MEKNGMEGEGKFQEVRTKQCQIKNEIQLEEVVNEFARTNEIHLIDGNRILKVEIRVYELVKFALCWGCRKIMGGSELGLLF